MEFVLTFLVVAVVTTVCLTFLMFVYGSVTTAVVKEKAKAEHGRWHPSEDLG